LGEKDSRSVYNVVIDHVSTSWSEDEVISMGDGVEDVTVSWSIISEALGGERREDKHSAGLLITHGSNRVSIHHNLFAHNDFRNPLINLGGTHDVTNNIIYDWGIEATAIRDLFSDTFVNFVGNYYIPGPSTIEGIKPITVISEDPETGERGRSVPKLFASNNFRNDTGASNEEIDVFYSFQIDPDFIEGENINEQIEWVKRTYFVNDPFDTSPVTTLGLNDNYNKVLNEAGAIKPKRDSVDNRIVNEVKTNTGKIIDSTSQVGGFPAMQGGIPPIDNDHDGMPDSWEYDNGLNPNDISDGKLDQDEDGYTNVEEYLFEISINI